MQLNTPNVNIHALHIHDTVITGAGHADGNWAINLENDNSSSIIDKVTIEHNTFRNIQNGLLNLNNGAYVTNVLYKDNWIDLPAAGTVNTSGTTVTCLTGCPFKFEWATGPMVINGVTYTAYSVAGTQQFGGNANFGSIVWDNPGFGSGSFQVLGTPVITLGAGAGTGATYILSAGSTAYSGSVFLTTAGTPTLGGVIFSITVPNNSYYNNQPINCPVQATVASGAVGNIIYDISDSTTTLLYFLNYGTALTTGTAYRFQWGPCRST